MSPCAPRAALAAILLLLCASPSAAEETDGSEQNCYDAIVFGKIVEQTPASVSMDCGPDCIVMRWPWFMEIDVARVLRGRAPLGRMTIITVQHTYFRETLGPQRWRLRRNSLGNFNMVWDDAHRCEPYTPAATPYIRPGEGETLRDLVRTGQKKYGRQLHRR